MTDDEHCPQGQHTRRPVPASEIRTKITDLDGAVSTRQLTQHLANNGASEDAIATVALLPERKWADYNEALAAASSGFRFDPETPSSNT